METICLKCQILFPGVGWGGGGGGGGEGGDGNISKCGLLKMYPECEAQSSRRRISLMHIQGRFKVAQIFSYYFSS